MSKKHSISIEKQIQSALDTCIGKMADRLMNTFNPENKDSLSLFRQFCSALKTRLQWIRNTAKTMQEVAAAVTQTKETIKNQPEPSNTGSANTGPTWTERMLNRVNPNHPLQPKDLNNGLVITK